jgi:hypothetical protein
MLELGSKPDRAGGRRARTPDAGRRGAVEPPARLARPALGLLSADRRRWWNDLRRDERRHRGVRWRGRATRGARARRPADAAVPGARRADGGDRRRHAPPD